VARVTEQVVVCDACGGEIPTGADFIGNVNGVLVAGGEQTGFADKDFCCTEHMLDWVQQVPAVPTPSPPYPPPAQ
jgi:hypothetical protein